MRHAASFLRVFSLALIVGLLPGHAAAQSVVPPFVKFAGTIPAAEGPALVTFTLYAEATGGEALWTETQAVNVDAGGRYAVLLGATEPAGLPPSLFAAGAPRWVGVRVGETELPRVLLTSTPYALKAGDAETIAGRPLSAFVLAGETTGVGADGLTYVNPKTLNTALGGAFAPTATGGSANYIGKFTSATELGNSALYETGGSVGLGTTAPAANLHVVGTMAPAAFFEVVGSLGALPAVYRAARGTPAAPAALQTDDIIGGLAVRGYDGTAFSQGRGQVMFRAAQNWTPAAHGTYLSMTTTPLNTTNWIERMRIDPAGNVGIGTSTPAQKLSVAGIVESTTGGFKFPDGTTQTTASSGGASYSAGTGLSLASNVFSVNFGGTGSATTVARSDHSHTGYATLGANTFTGTQTISSGGVVLPVTTNSSSGVVRLGAYPFLHAYGTDNLFVGAQAGNFSTTGYQNVGVGTLALDANTTGSADTAVGIWSLMANTTGTYNTAVGSSSLQANTVGLENTAVGYGGLNRNTEGNWNSAFGNTALFNNTTGGANTAIGNGALRTNTTGGRNSALGVYALLSNTTGLGNSAIGKETLWRNTTGSSNTGIGDNSLTVNQVGTNNTTLGASADVAVDGLTYATAVGAGAVVGASNSLVLGAANGQLGAVKVGIGTTTPAEKLTVVGVIQSTLGGFKFPDGTTQTTASTGGTYTAGDGLNLATNVFSVNFAGSGSATTVARSDHAHAGYATLGSNIFSATQTIAAGNLALPATSGATSGVLTLGGNPFLHALGGTSNIFVGSGAGGGFVATGQANTAVGSNALFGLTNGNGNTALGASALSLMASGVANTAVGGGALAANVGGGDNTAVGEHALMSSTANGNTAVGSGALQTATTATDNTAVGLYSLHLVTNSSNTAVGSHSLDSATDAGANTAVGANALTATITGDANTGIGSSALRHLTTGSWNTGAGTYAGDNVTTGHHNSFLGYSARADATTPDLTYAVAIGAHAIVGASNAIALGGTGSYAVSVGIATSMPADRLQVVGDVRVGTSGTNGCVKNYSGGAIVGTCSSDVRLKTNITPFGRVLDRVARLRPVHYEWKANDFPSYHFGTGTQSGLVAQDVEQVFPDLVATDEHGFKMVNYTDLPLLSVAAVGELKAQNDALAAQVAGLREENTSLKSQLSALAERLSKLEQAQAGPGK